MRRTWSEASSESLLKKVLCETEMKRTEMRMGTGVRGLREKKVDDPSQSARAFYVSSSEPKD